MCILTLHSNFRCIRNAARTFRMSSFALVNRVDVSFSNISFDAARGNNTFKVAWNSEHLTTRQELVVSVPNNFHLIIINVIYCNFSLIWITNMPIKIHWYFTCGLVESVLHWSCATFPTTGFSGSTSISIFDGGKLTDSWTLLVNGFCVALFCALQ